MRALNTYIFLPPPSSSSPGPLPALLWRLFNFYHNLVRATSDAKDASGLGQIKNAFISMLCSVGSVYTNTSAYIQLYMYICIYIDSFSSYSYSWIYTTKSTLMRVENALNPRTPHSCALSLERRLPELPQLLLQHCVSCGKREN